MSAFCFCRRETFDVNSNEARQDIFASLKELRDNELFVDLTIGLDGGSSVSVHKCVVAAASRLYNFPLLARVKMLLFF